MFRPILAPALLLPILAGCGPAKVPEPRETVIPAEDAPSAAPAADGGPQVTAIDAATGDGRRMPADFRGPSPYELAARAAAQRERASEAPPILTPPPPGAAPPVAEEAPPGGN